MPIGDIYVAKELSATYKPLFLVEFTFRNGQKYRVASEPLVQAYGGTPSAGSYEYNEVPWYPRVLNQDIGATQSMSDLGIDYSPNVTIILADPDKGVFAQELDVGFKGARMVLYAVMWDALDQTTGSFSSNTPAPIKFIGTCSAPVMGEKTMTITATSLMNMTQTQMPPIRIQPTCAWTFPPTFEARSAAVSNNSESLFGECGYSPDQEGGVGNYETGTACFTSCAYTFEDCVARLGNPAELVQINQDTSGRRTGRFGGFQWIPSQSSGRQRSFVTGKWEEVLNASNEARYGDYVPMPYGTSWLDPLVMGMWTDGNYTNFEVLISYGKVNKIKELIVNGRKIPRLRNDSVSGYRDISTAIPADSTVESYTNGFWKTINNGDRNGLASAEPGWGKKGDPYGSYCAIHVSVLKEVAKEGEIPRVQVLLEGQHIRVYSDSETYTVEYTDNPAWILMDLLIWNGWRYSEIDIASFVLLAAKCDQQISFVRMDGTYTNTLLESGAPPYRRFMCGFSLRQRRPSPEIIRGVRNNMRSILYFDFNTGKLTAMMKETLAEQQPAPITGSNYNTPVPSILADGSEADGYVAYHFNASSIKKTEDGSSTLSISQRANQDSPNKVTIGINNRENTFNPDSATISDVEDMDRMNNEVVGSFAVEGLQTFDHAYRVTNTWFAETFRGNPRLDYLGSDRGDTGGTLEVELKTTVKALHLGIGQLCLVSDAQHGITNQLMRIKEIQWSMDAEEATVKLSWHNDNWYRDTYGQVNQPLYLRGRSIVDRPPFAWMPDVEAPVAGDALYDETRRNFTIKQRNARDSDGTARVFTEVTGKVPINKNPNEPGKPRLELIGQGAEGGGYPLEETYYLGLAAKDRVGTAALLSPLSNLVTIKLTGAENALSFIPQRWFDSPSGYVAFAGMDPFALSYQFDDDTVPTGAITLTNTYNEASWGPPDEALNNFLFRIRTAQHLGVWGQSVVAADAGWIKVSTYDNYGFQPNEYAGREISVIGLYASPDRTATVIPIANFMVDSNTDNEFFVSNADPSTCIIGNAPLDTYDVVVMRFSFTHGEDDDGVYLEDAKAINPLNPITGPYTVAYVSNTSPIILTLAVLEDTPMPFETGDTIVVFGIIGNDGANGGFIVGTVDPDLFTVELVGSVGTGDYVSGGLCGRQYRGFNVDEEVGRIAYIISGKGMGQFAKIKSNTQTRLYIDGTWPISPDSTSRIVILDALAGKEIESNKISNKTQQLLGKYALDVTEFKGSSIFLEGLTQSRNRLTNPESLSPFREMYIYNPGDSFTYDILLAFSIDGDAEVGTSVCAPYTYLRDTPGYPVLASIWAIDLPVGGSLTIMSYLNGEDMLIDPIVLAPTSPETVYTQKFVFPIPILRFGDVITLDVLTVGTTSPGSKVSFELYIQSLDDPMDRQVKSVRPAAIADLSDGSDLGIIAAAI